METALTRRTFYFDGEPVELWSSTVPEFSCRADDLRHYIDSGRWDLVFNALCYLTGVVEEGSA
jgi:hypothetical protein